MPNQRKPSSDWPDGGERLIRSVIDLCTDCDCCRHIMDTSCLFFSQVYRLWDSERETGEPISAAELRHLADLCNYCGLCPCPNVREDIMTAKTLFIDRGGLAPAIRVLEDVERVGRLCGALPRLSNFFLQNRQTARFIKRAAGIHPRRDLPRFPQETFSSETITGEREKGSSSASAGKIAYFAGCTARYLFPQVARAAVDLLEHNGISAHVPEQHCCGMPSMLEGDRQTTLKFAERTISQLSAVVAEGYDIVCSCPTCGYMLKKVLLEGAYYSMAYQDLMGGDGQRMKIPGHPASGSAEKATMRVLNRSIYGRILKDDGYFSSIDPLKRIRVAENTRDLGEYLLQMHREGKLALPVTPLPGRTIYYPPCHLREQEIGMPYLELLALVPGISLESFGSTFYCCGIAGIMGFKKAFHNTSIQMGSRLMAAIKRQSPDRLLTDCLSCRLQFNQMSAYPVHHPVEILSKSCKK